MMMTGHRGRYQADLQPRGHWQEWCRHQKGNFYQWCCHQKGNFCQWKKFNQVIYADFQEACMACKLLQKRFGIKNVGWKYNLHHVYFLQWQSTKVKREKNELKKTKVATWLKNTDTDNDGKLSFTEFSKAVSNSFLEQNLLQCANPINRSNKDTIYTHS